MNHMEDEIKRRFENANSLEGVDPDELWGNISEAMEGTTSADNKKRRIPFAWWFLGLLVVGLFSSIYFLENKIEVEKIENTDDESSIVLSDKNVQKSETKNQIKEDDSGQIVSENLINEEEGKVANMNQQNKSNEPLSQTELNSNSLLVFLPNKNKSTDNFLEFNHSKNDNIESEKSKEVNDGAEPIEENISQFIPILPIHFLEIKNEKVRGGAEYISDETLEPVDPLKNKRWRLGLTVGGNYLATHFNSQNSSSNFDEKLNDTHRGQLGNSLAIYGEFELNEKLYLSTGLEYFSTRTRFDIVQEWDTIMWRDNMPGSELINARATRTVIHHNRQDYLAVPFMLGLSKEMGRFRAGLGGGVAINFFISQKGRTLNSESEIATIGGAELPFRKTFLSFQLQPHLHYRLVKDLEIGLQSMIRWQPHGQSGFYGLRQNTLLMGANFGVFLKI